MDLQRMNNSLLTKWLFRFYDNRVIDTWKYIIIDKYSQACDRCLKSTLWNDILKFRYIIQDNTTWQLGTGEKIQF